MIKQEVIEALGHKEVIDNKVEPTCSTTGLTEGKHCSVCNEVLIKQEVIEALGHNYKIEIIESTCTKEGNKRTYCLKCDDYIEEKIPLKEHRESDWILDKEPTKSEKGHKHTECLDCEKVLQEVDIEKLKGGCGRKSQAILMVYTTLMPLLIYIFRRRR